jgi:hypothetical protein
MISIVRAKRYEVDLLGAESSVGYAFRHNAFLPEMYSKRGHITTGITLEPSLQD